MSLLWFARTIVTGGVRRASTRAAHTNEELASRLKQWKLISLLVAFPGIGLCMLNCYINYHKHERPEFIPYDHLRIRAKPYPWGDGRKSFFHNPHINALPDGYEDIDEHH